MAIEDSIVLAEELATKSTVAEALQGYMRRRFDRSRMIYENSIQLGEWEKDPADPAADPAGLSAKSLGLLAQPPLTEINAKDGEIGWDAYRSCRWGNPCRSRPARTGSSGPNTWPRIVA